MNHWKVVLLSAALGVVILFSGNSWANKAEAKIEVPEAAAKGVEVIIRVTVTHNADSYLHHVEWLWIQVNGNEIARWDYTATNRPGGATFTKEIKYKLEDKAEIKAKASCNMHGSSGEAVTTILVRE